MIQGPNGVPTHGPVRPGRDGDGRRVGPAVINHLNRDKVVSVEFNTSGRSMGEVTADAFARMLALSPPTGHSRGRREARRSSRASCSARSSSRSASRSGSCT